MNERQFKIEYDTLATRIRRVGENSKNENREEALRNFDYTLHDRRKYAQKKELEALENLMPATVQGAEDEIDTKTMFN